MVCIYLNKCEMSSNQITVTNQEYYINLNHAVFFLCERYTMEFLILKTIDQDKLMCKVIPTITKLLSVTGIYSPWIHI